MADEQKNPGESEPQGSLPFDDDARYEEGGEGIESDPPIFPVGTFKYDGRGMTADEFSTHVQNYNFGSILPDFIVLHHTAKPFTMHTWPDVQQSPESWLRNSSQAEAWDSGEAGLSEEQIKQRRKQRLDRIRNDYAGRPGWDAGPHLFIDDKYIWLFTPMYEYGIHAKWGNKIVRGGKTHYSIGIEVVGYYENQQWPPAVRQLVRHTVTTLQAKLATFQLKYMYPNGNPGITGTGDDQRPAHPEKLTWGGISSHRDYNKPGCPGAAISEDFYLKVLRGEI